MDTRELRNTLGEFATDVCVVSTESANGRMAPEHVTLPRKKKAPLKLSPSKPSKRQSQGLGRLPPHEKLTPVPLRMTLFGLQTRSPL